jgi:Protein of unknown function (DUF2793)
MSELSSRYRLPLLVAGQGQKDVTHNEAIEAIDMLLHPVIIDRTLAAPPGNPVAGQCWLIADAATGAWLGRSGELACWTVGGWRFVQPAEGYTAWVRSEGRRTRRTESGWRDETPFEAPVADIAEPSGGAVIDLEARTAISALLGQLADVGLIMRI